MNAPRGPGTPGHNTGGGANRQLPYAGSDSYGFGDPH